MAKYVEREILSTIKQLKIFPTAYPKDEYASTNEITIRLIIKWHYKILFSIDMNTTTVRIIGIFHTAQNPAKLNLYK
jgi:plasmid stabilization system protein ParE